MKKNRRQSMMRKKVHWQETAPKVRAGDLLDTDISFDLERLFDEYNLDHIPRRKRLEQFNCRDLREVKYYRTAARLFNNPLEFCSRERIIYAPPMETPMKHRLGHYMNRTEYSPLPQMHADLHVKTEDKEKGIGEKEADATEVKDKGDKKENIELSKYFEEDEGKDNSDDDTELKEREKSYRKWLEERKKFRASLEGVGLNIDYLRRKPDKTEVEQRVLDGMIAKEKATEIPASVESSSVSISTVSIKSPDSARKYMVSPGKLTSPWGIRILEKHLRKNKMRLLDLFTSVDKDKNWRLSKEEFKLALFKAKLPLSEALVDDLILSLDVDLDGHLDYKEMSIGMDIWRKEKREFKKWRQERMKNKSFRARSGSPGQKVAHGSQSKRLEQQRESTVVMTNNPAITTVKYNESPTISVGSSIIERDGSVSRSEGSPNKRKGSAVAKSDASSPDKRNGSAVAKSDVSSPPKRKGSTVPKSDALSPTKRNGLSEPPSSSTKHRTSSASKGQEEKQRRNSSRMEEHSRSSTPSQLYEVPSSYFQEEEVKESESDVWLTGNKAIDDHNMKSTLDSETAEIVDKFRQLKLQEFVAITNLCKTKNVPLTAKLLERVLLYPPEKPTKLLKRKLGLPEQALLSSHFADPPKEPPVPIEVKHKDKIKRSDSGVLYIDTRHRYPMRSNVAARLCKMNLSTGKTLLSRQVDCWMTFEEYERLTSHLAVRFKHLYGNNDDNAFWPGHLLEKLRLCLPPYNKPVCWDKKTSIFQKKVNDRIYHHGKRSAWPFTPERMFVNGIYDDYARKPLLDSKNIHAPWK